MATFALPSKEGLDNVLVGWEFSATLQLRTPLRILTRHGELWHKLDVEPPTIIQELWEGIWIPKTRTWNELGGEDIPDFLPQSMASDIGPIPPDGGLYLEFLISVRKIVESSATIDERIHSLTNEISAAKWAEISNKMPVQNVIDYFFPNYLDAFLFLSSKARLGLMAEHFDSAPSLAGCDISKLIKINGIGLKTAERLVQAAAILVEQGILERLDNVRR